jgi:hypothetical protein
MKKNVFKNVALLFAVVLAFSSCASMKMAKDPLAQYVGQWDYAVENLPVDIDGTFIITNVEGTLMGKLVNPMGELEIGEVKIVDGALEASFDADGNYVMLKGNFEGETYSGALTVMDTDFPMKMTKMIETD